MNKQTVYKVVKIDDGIWRSSLYGLHQSEFSLNYEIAKRTTAKRGTLGVLVFRERECAVRFMKIESHGTRYAHLYQIFECDGYGRAVPVVNLASDSKYYRFPHYRRLQLVDRFCSLVRRHAYAQTMGSPLGTFSVESVIPRKVVD